MPITKTNVTPKRVENIVGNKAVTPQRFSQLVPNMLGFKSHTPNTLDTLWVRSAHVNSTL